MDRKRTQNGAAQKGAYRQQPSQYSASAPRKQTDRRQGQQRTVSRPPQGTGQQRAGARPQQGRQMPQNGYPAAQNGYQTPQNGYYYGQNGYYENGYYGQSGYRGQKKPPARPSKPPKPKLTKEQIEAENIRRRVEKQIIREQRRERFKYGVKVFFGRLLLTVIVYIAILAVCVGYNAVDILWHTEGRNADYLLQFGDEKEKKPMYGDAVCLRVNGGTAVYLSMADVAEQYGWAVTGDLDELRFVVPCTDELGNQSYETVRFYDGSAMAYVNNSRVELSAPAFFDGYDDVYVPADFFQSYVNGIRYRHDTVQGRIYLIRQELADVTGELSEEERYLPISFRLKEAVLSPSMDENAFVRDFIIGELDE